MDIGIFFKSALIITKTPNTRIYSIDICEEITFLTVYIESLNRLSFIRQYPRGNAFQKKCDNFVLFTPCYKWAYILSVFDITQLICLNCIIVLTLYDVCSQLSHQFLGDGYTTL